MAVTYGTYALLSNHVYWVSLSGLPIGENHKTHTVKSHTGAAATKEVVEFGTAQAACDFETTGILP